MNQLDSSDNGVFMLIKSMEISHLLLSYDFSDMLLLNGGIYLTDLYQNCLRYDIYASAVGKFIDTVFIIKKHTAVLE